MSQDQRYIASCDTLKKINVTNWPNVFNLQSVLLEHTLAISYMCLLDNNQIASLSEPCPYSKQQDLIISEIADARVLHKSKV